MSVSGPGSGTDRLVITGARLLEPADGEISDVSWIEMAGGRIVASGPGEPGRTGADVAGLDVAGATVLPGLIDAHVHVVLTTLDAREAAGWTPGYATVRALRAAEQMLRRGFTTVRDVGGADHGMARAIAEGLVPGPRLIFGGKALSQTGGHGDSRGLNDDTVACCQARPGFARIADGVDEVRRAARDEFRKGAAHLKVLVSGGVASPHDDVSAVQYSDDELAAAVGEAANAGRYVTAHAYHPRAINRALAAGVRCIEHGNLLDDSSLALFAEQDAFLVPTLVTYEQLLRAPGLAQRSQEKLAEVRDAALGALDRAHRAGVAVVFGTDLLAGMQSAQLEEFNLRAQVQSAAAVIRSATTTAARLLGLAGEIGTLAPGAHADLIVVDGDPVADIGVLTRPDRHLRHVIQAGQVLGA